MEGIKTDSPAARFLAESLGDEPFTLLDVGCAGGLDPGWRVFGDRLRALGFDASLSEVARQQADEDRPKVEYVGARVGPPRGHALDDADNPSHHWWRRSPWGSLAVARLAQGAVDPSTSTEGASAPKWAWPVPDPLRDLPTVLTPIPADPQRLPPSARWTEPVQDDADWERHGLLMRQNRWAETATASADAPVHLPDILADRGLDDIDFVKIDVDGPDYAILTSLEAVFAPAQVMGLSLEVNFFGSDAPHHHSFHNTDRYLRRHRFDLYGLTVRTYASAALPRRYALPTPGAAVGGRALQGDAFYARDTAWKGEGEIAPSLPTGKLIKLAAIFALFDLPDQAAEVAIRHRVQLEGRLDVGRFLDLLTEEAWPGSGLSHGELIARFEAGDPMFHP